MQMRVLKGVRTHAEAKHDAADDELGQLVGGTGEDSADQEADAAQQHGAAATVAPAGRANPQAQPRGRLNTNIKPFHFLCFCTQCLCMHANMPSSP